MTELAASKEIRVNQESEHFLTRSDACNIQALFDVRALALDTFIYDLIN